MGQIYISWNVKPLQDVLMVHGTRSVIRADIMGMSVTTRKKGRLPGPAERILNSVGEGRRMMTQVTGNVLKVLRKKLLRYHGLQMLVGEFYQSIRGGRRRRFPSTMPGRSSIGPSGLRGRPIRPNRRALPSLRPAARLKRSSPGRPASSAGICSTDSWRKEIGVRILVRHDPGEELMRDDRVEVFLGNLGSREDVERAVEGTSEVFHLGATVEGGPRSFSVPRI